MNVPSWHMFSTYERCSAEILRCHLPIDYTLEEPASFFYEWRSAQHSTWPNLRSPHTFSGTILHEPLSTQRWQTNVTSQHAAFNRKKKKKIWKDRPANMITKQTRRHSTATPPPGTPQKAHSHTLPAQPTVLYCTPPTADVNTIPRPFQGKPKPNKARRSPEQKPLRVDEQELDGGKKKTRLSPPENNKDRLGREKVVALGSKTFCHENVRPQALGGRAKRRNPTHGEPVALAFAPALPLREDLGNNAGESIRRRVWVFA